MTFFAWRCPFCGHHSTIGDNNYLTSSDDTGVASRGDGEPTAHWSSVTRLMHDAETLEDMLDV